MRSEFRSSAREGFSRALGRMREQAWQSDRVKPFKVSHQAQKSQIFFFFFFLVCVMFTEHQEEAVMVRERGFVHSVREGGCGHPYPPASRSGQQGVCAWEVLTQNCWIRQPFISHPPCRSPCDESRKASCMPSLGSLTSSKGKSSLCPHIVIVCSVLSELVQRKGLRRGRRITSSGRERHQVSSFCEGVTSKRSSEGSASTERAGREVGVPSGVHRDLGWHGGGCRWWELMLTLMKDAVSHAQEFRPC